jgi:serine/threonine protein kinase
MVGHSWIGQTLGGRYKIEELLGQGGMSAVYKGMDPNLKRVVAIKMIHPHLSDNPEFVVRFKEEAAAVAQLRHPNIVQVFDFNSDDNLYYMVMEFVPGETLQARLKRLNAAQRHLPIGDALRFAVQVCEAADYAHQRGMIHRDIKPANVMLDIHGQAILTDFGIAKIIGGQTHTATGATVGTALYMSPEQIRGLEVDGRSDVYSIGVTLFEMLNGRPPYEADSAMTLMMMHLNDPVPDLHQVRPDTPDDLVQAIERALAKNPAERFHTAAEMATALSKVVERLQSPASGVTVVDRPTREERPAAQPIGEGIRPAPASAVVSPAQLRPGPAPAAAQAAQRSAGTRSRASSPVERSSNRSGGGLDSLKRKASPRLLAGGVVGVLALLILAFVIGTQFSGADANPASTAQNTVQAMGFEPGEGSPSPTLGVDATGTAAALALVAAPTEAPTATATEEPPTATVNPTETPTPQPTATVAPTATESPPTPTYPPAATNTPTVAPSATTPPGPYARITGITVQGDTYVIAYETIGFTESYDKWHTHFFFNTVSPEQAGVPGAGPWKLYYGPSPFTDYKVSERPYGAGQMCVRVANADHSLYYLPSGSLDTGNCVNLP